MNFGERTAQRKRTKDLKNEVRQVKKEMLSAGCEKGTVNACLKEFQETMELGSTLKTEYENAGEHLRLARDSIEKLLECMGESPSEEVKKSLTKLVGDLDLVYHDCSIRSDDLDFRSTIECLKRMVGGFEGGSASMAIMLRSELENIKSVLDDTSGWKAPDFFALAYFFQHEDKDGIKEMENEQRNAYVLSYLKEHFWDAFLKECGKAGNEHKVQELVQSYIYE